MKKIKPFTACVLLSGAFLIGSCTLSHTVVVTNNPIGSKTGEVSAADVDVDSGVTYSKAMKEAGISKAAIAEYKYKSYVFFAKEFMRVKGE